jgi:lipopolysaccharide/colanic/teichoic acid biosynthesis glycosyltransferase
MLELVINNNRINNIRYLNKYFEAVNNSLKINGVFKGNVETYSIRSSRILKNSNTPLNRIHLFLDIIFFRIFPKLSVTKKIYFFITKGKGRAFSKSEIFGRLYSCGFEIVKEEFKNNKIFFTAKKIKEPLFDTDSSYGLLIKLKRVGQYKKIIKVYKLRTMRPYSEFLQDYIYKINNLEVGGKIKNDFRISKKGKILRKFWIDELPMLINIIKGDVKLVGVRPLSIFFFNLYNKELQNLRTQFKPGFIPPFYVDLPETLEEIMASETKYLNLYKKAPFTTDIKYFFLAFKNVLFKGIRSK